LREKGYNPMLEGHPHLDMTNGVHWTTGSEGHGFPAGMGMAFAKKKLNKKGRVFVLVGDGECQEGTTWESLLLGGHHKLDNLTVIMDNNKIQGSGYVDDILPVSEKMGVVSMACGWDVATIDGHNDLEINSALTRPTDKPRFIIANTVKGKGVDFMENRPEWHSKWPNAAQEAEILKQLS
jgi:transketolase